MVRVLQRGNIGETLEHGPESFAKVLIINWREQRSVGESTVRIGNSK